MKKKILYVISCLLLITMVAACGKKPEEPTETDAKKFKQEYESLNGTSNASGLEHRTVTIAEDNPFVYTTAEEIVKKIENNETFYLYVGDKQCPWCRSVIEKSIEVAKDYGVKQIYYVNIWDDNHNEILRDVYELDENNEPKKVIEGTEAYGKLLGYFEELLRDYTLTDTAGNVVPVGEKRIFAPNFIFVKNGKARNLTTGKSDKQTNSREPLTEEILAEQEEALSKFFAVSAACDSEC